MQCRASAPLARRIEGWSPKPCLGRPARIFFFCCIAERAIKPCRSSRSKLRGEFGIPRHLQNRNQKHNKATNKQNTKQTKDKNRQVLECETRGEKRVMGRPARKTRRTKVMKMKGSEGKNTNK